jgi:NAD(P)-dependent dehydrogenase (short-subunit alcohol dehydrogenase family)
MNSVFQPGFLQNKHLFVTGGSSGICLAVAQQFAAFGASVSILGRSPEKIERALPSLGPNAQGYPADVRSFDAVASALKAAHDASGQIDILICGAAGNFPAPALGMSANGFKAVIDIDVLGTFNTCRAAYEYLRKPGATIINISAAQAFRAMAFQSHVCAAKAGVDMLTRTLAIEWGPAGIRVNSVTPGAVDGTEGVRRLAPDEESRKAWMAKTALGRFASTDDIAALCLFLASPAASYITGAILVCDGGLSLA